MENIGNIVPSEAQRMSQVSEQFAHMERVIAETDELIKVLFERLKPAMRMEAGKGIGNDENAKIQQALCPLADRIRIHVRAIDEINNYIRYQKGLIEI